MTQYADTNLTLPSSGTVVTKDSTDTLTNKSIDQDGTGNSITNIADASIKAAAAIASSKLAGMTHSADAVNLIPKLIRGQFVYSDQPGTGTYTVFSSTDIPDNAIIVDSLIDVTSTFVGTGDDANTIAIHVEGADDIVAAIAISNGANPWDAGLHAGIPVGTAATAIKLTAARDLTVTLADGAGVLSAGQMDIYLWYIEGS